MFWRIPWWGFALVSVLAVTFGVLLWLHAPGSPSAHYKGDPTDSDLNWWAGAMCFVGAATCGWLSWGRARNRL